MSPFCLSGYVPSGSCGGLALANYSANANAKYYSQDQLPLQHFLFTVTFPVAQPTRDSFTKCHQWDQASRGNVLCLETSNEPSTRPHRSLKQLQMLFVRKRIVVVPMVTHWPFHWRSTDLSSAQLQCVHLLLFEVSDQSHWDSQSQGWGGSLRSYRSYQTHLQPS